MWLLARWITIIVLTLVFTTGRGLTSDFCDELNWLCGSFAPFDWGGFNSPAIQSTPASPPSSDTIQPCDRKFGRCEIDGAPRWPGEQWPVTTFGKLNAPPNAKPGDFWPATNYAGTSNRVNKDLDAVRANCSGVDPHCLSPVFGADAKPVGFQGGDPRVPSPQRTEIASGRLTTPGTDPVAPNGSFRIAETDLRFPGFIPYSFTRYYRSDVTLQSPIGFGWNHNYGRRIVPTSGCSDSAKGCGPSAPDVLYVSETMDQIRFSHSFSDNEGVHYTAALEPSLRLYKALGQDGAWVLQEIHELLYYIFEPEYGDLVSIHDHTGHAITLTWKHPPAINGGVYEDPSGYLDTVVDTRGQSIYYRYAEPGSEPITPPFPGLHAKDGKRFRPLRCITLSAAADACASAPLLTFQIGGSSPRAKDDSHPEFNLVHVADAKGNGPTYTYYGDNILDYRSLDTPYVPDEILEATCTSVCGSKQDDYRNFDLCSVEAIRPCDVARTTYWLSRADREASAVFKFCMSVHWDGTNEHFEGAYHDCNQSAGCPIGEKNCNAYGAVNLWQCWRWPGWDERGDALPRKSCGWGYNDYVYGGWDSDKKIDHVAQLKQQCIAQAQAVTAPDLPKCRADCKTQCLATKAAHDHTGARRYAYGVPLSLNHNLLKVIDADQRVVIENTYGTDPFSSDFDRVIQHVQGSGADNVMKFEYHDFASEQSAFATKPAPEADLLAGFKSVQICPAAQSGSGYASPQLLALPNSIQQPTYGVKITDIAGVTRINYFDGRWNPLREVNDTAGVQVNYNYRDGFVTAVQDTFGARSCFERDDAGRVTQSTRLPFPTHFNGKPWVSALPDVTTYSYDDAGMLIEVIRDPDGPAPTGMTVIRDGYERVAAIGQSVSLNKTLWTCYGYVPPPQYSTGAFGMQSPNLSTSSAKLPEKSLPGRTSDLGFATAPQHTVQPQFPTLDLGFAVDLQHALQPQTSQGQLATPHRLSFLQSGCARNLALDSYNPAKKVAVAPYTIWKPDGTSIMQSSMTAFGPSEVAEDAQGEDAVLTYIEHDLADPFGLNYEAGRGSLNSKKFGSATRVIADKTTGIVQTIGTQDPNDGAWVDSTLSYGASRQLTGVKESSVERQFDTDEIGHLRSVQESPRNDAFGTPSRTACFRYDMLGRILDRMLPEGNVEHYTYNALGQLVSVNREAVSEVPPWASACSLPAALPGQIIQQSVGQTTTAVALPAPMTQQSVGRTSTAAALPTPMFQQSLSQSSSTIGGRQPVGACDMPQQNIDKPERVFVTYDKGGARYRGGPGRIAHRLRQGWAWADHRYDGLTPLC